jgi:SH3 domain protein
MRNRLALRCAVLAISACLSAAAANAESVWVSDEFEIMLRTGPSTNNAIERMLSSGTELEVLDTDPDAGYSQVRTTVGTEGWVLTRYLMGEPPAREQLERLTGQLTNANTRGSSLGSQLDAIRAEQKRSEDRANSLESERDALQTELGELKRKAANVLAIDTQNQNLRLQLTDAEMKVSVLEQENESLGAQGNRYWFITGALVLVGGILLGLVLPRIKFQRRSRYDRL